jgi:hypothetical protein
VSCRSLELSLGKAMKAEACSACLYVIVMLSMGTILIIMMR